MPVSKIRKRLCQHCGASYTLGVESTQHKYCSITCRSAYHNAHGGRKYRRSDKGKASMFAWRLKAHYGIDVAQYNKILADQKSCCAICSRLEPTGYGWHVDHDHATGKVRGILCSKCNQGLGLFGDQANVLKSAAAYLETHNESS